MANGWTLEQANRTVTFDLAGRVATVRNDDGSQLSYQYDVLAPLLRIVHSTGRRMEFAYAGGGTGKGGKATLFVDGKKVGEGDVEATLATIFSADDGTDVGEDSGAAISPDYGTVGNHFNGEIKGVELSIVDDPNNSDHLVKPEDAIGAALGRQ